MKAPAPSICRSERKSTAAKPAAGLRSVKAPSTSAATREEEVRSRAYRLYEERGREDGHALDDWLQADEEVPSRDGNKRGAI
jgi:hypothetical protein